MIGESLYDVGDEMYTKTRTLKSAFEIVLIFLTLVMIRSHVGIIRFKLIFDLRSVYCQIPCVLNLRTCLFVV